MKKKTLLIVLTMLGLLAFLVVDVSRPFLNSSPTRGTTESPSASDIAPINLSALRIFQHDHSGKGAP
jgi:hypothetical protein